MFIELFVMGVKIYRSLRGLNDKRLTSFSFGPPYQDHVRTPGRLAPSGSNIQGQTQTS